MPTDRHSAIPSLSSAFFLLCLAGAGGLLAGCQSAGGGPRPRATGAAKNESAVFADAADEEPGLLMRMLGRSKAKAPPEPTPFEEYGRTRAKPLTVPQDTVNALRLMAQDWVLDARKRPPKIRTVAEGGYVKEYNTFADKYTLEIERAEEEDDATLMGFVFLDSTYMRTAAHADAASAQADTEFHEQRRKLRMTFRLLERWEFSELAEAFVFNRVWELARVQYKPYVPTAARPPASPAPVVQPPQATPRQ